MSNTTTTTTTTATLMKALVFEPHKDVPAIVHDIPRPLPSAANQVQVKVEYAALDHGLDAVLYNTWIGKFLHQQSKPLLLGWHYSGTVTAVYSGRNDDNNDKDNNKTFQVGDTVFGHLEHSPQTCSGTLAEYIVVPASTCAHRPKRVDASLAAAASVEASTALQALRDHGQLQPQRSNSSIRNNKNNDDQDQDHPPGQPSVLVIGAAGGVGSAAVQIARNMGAHVTAVCSAKDAARVLEYGADVVLSREEHPHPLLSKSSTKYDVIFDTPAILSVTQALQHLQPQGQYVTTMPSWSLFWGTLASLFSSKGVHMVSVKPRREDLMLIANWMLQGQLNIPIDSVHKIKDVSQAIQRQRERKTGRVVVQVEHGW